MNLNVKIIGAFIMCIFIGFSSVLVARGSDGLPMYVSKQSIDDYKTNIEAEKQELERVSGLIKDSKLKLDEYEALLNGSDNKLRDKLYSELDYYKITSGKAAVHGNGVVVFVDDGTRDLYQGENVNNILVHDRDVLGILNEMKRSGAEAISVNGQRIVNTSAISCAGYTIRINDQTYARPFEIRAVGDAKRMASALVAPEGYATYLKNWGVICKVTIKDDITIPSYKEEQTYKYVMKVSEGEKK